MEPITYTVPTDADGIIADVRALLVGMRELHFTPAMQKRADLVELVVRADALVPAVDTIELHPAPAPCAACAARHSDTCAMRVPPADSRDDAIANMTDDVNARVPEEFRDIVIAKRTAEIDALYVCNCKENKPGTSTPRATGTGAARTRQATMRMAWSIADGHIDLELGDNRDSFVLPTDLTADAEFRKLNADMKAWLLGNGGSDGQVQAAFKIVRDKYRYAAGAKRRPIPYQLE